MGAMWWVQWALALLLGALGGLGVSSTTEPPAVMGAAPAQTGTAAPDGGTAAQTASLRVVVSYAGDFYSETFGYAPDAPNIRHYALVLPAELAAQQEEALRALSGLEFPAGNAPGLLMREERRGDAWVLGYLHAAPGGEATLSLPPGDYLVTGLFIAAPLSREEASVGDDAVLYAGITGGGASRRTFTPLTLRAGEPAELEIALGDDDGWG